MAKEINRQIEVPLTERVKDNWSKFEQHLIDFGIEDISLIKKAFTHAHFAHEGQWRISTDEGTKHFVVHPIAVTIELIKSGIRDPKILAAGLNHDNPEDSGFFSNPIGKTYSRYIADVKKNMIHEYNYPIETAEYVEALTEPSIDGVEIKNEQMKKRIKLENLITGPVESVLIKMSDRLHNLETPYGSVSKRARKIKETEEFYIPVFARVRESQYKEQYDYFMPRINNVLAKLKKAGKR